MKHKHAAADDSTPQVRSNEVKRLMKIYLYPNFIAFSVIICFILNIMMNSHVVKYIIEIIRPNHRWSVCPLVPIRCYGSIFISSLLLNPVWIQIHSKQKQNKTNKQKKTDKSLMRKLTPLCTDEF